MRSALFLQCRLESGHLLLRLLYAPHDEDDIHEECNPNEGVGSDKERRGRYYGAVDICKDKHIYITRYPAGDYFHSFPSKITVLSTTDTCKMVIDGEEYNHYPIVDINANPTTIPQMFTEVVTMSNTRLAGLGGDYDKLNCRFQGVILDSLRA